MLLVVVLLKRRAAGTSAAASAEERTTSRRMGLPTPRLRGRHATSSDSPDLPRQRRQRLKLGLAVTGLPVSDEPDEAEVESEVEFFDPEFAPAPLATNAAGTVETLDDPVVDDDAAPEFDDAPFEPRYTAPDSGPIYPPLALDLASYAGSVAPVPVGASTHHEDENGVVFAPGWPSPGEISAELDDFAYYASGATATAEDTTLTTDADAADSFDLAESWSVGDEGLSSDPDWAAPDPNDESVEAPQASWDDAPVEQMVAAGVVGDETPTWTAESWDGSDAATEDAEHDGDASAEAWQEPDWSWEPDDADDTQDLDTSAPAEPAVVDVDDALEWESLTNDARDVVIDDPPGVDADDLEWGAPPATEPTPTGPPAAAAAIEVPDEPIAAIASQPVNEPSAGFDTPTPAPAIPTSTLPEAPIPAQARVHTAATKKLAKRVAAAEAELQRIAKRASGKKGDLRKAGKKKIAKQVRKALRDPELSDRFDIRVGKGRLSYERRDDDLTLGPVHSTAEPSVGKDLLQALEGPLRASVLSNLLADYATAEAHRRIADVLRTHGSSPTVSSDFDQLVARLTEVSQGPLLGLPPQSVRSAPSTM